MSSPLDSGRQAVEIERPVGGALGSEKAASVGRWQEVLAESGTPRRGLRSLLDPGGLRGLVARALSARGYVVCRTPTSFAGGDSGRGVAPQFLVETHHRAYGRHWCLGRDQFDYVLACGLEPGHFLLDLGCGALRAGIWLVRYLETGRYHGLDAHLPSLVAARDYELPLHGLEHKRPRLLWSSEFQIEHFGVEFDFVLAFSLLNHLTEVQRRHALSKIRHHLAPTGRLIVSHELPFDPATLEGNFGLRLVRQEVRPCLLVDDEIRWHVLERDG